LSLIRRVVFGDNPRRTLTRVAVLATVSFVTFRWVLVPIRTEGSSMLPTYQPNRLNLVNRLAYVGDRPVRRDVVAIQMAGPHVLYVKRVIGLPGERVSVVDGIVNIDGAPLTEPYVKNRRPWKVDEVTLGPTEYFVIGDNRGMSAGDHDFGRVEFIKILGKVVF
jgi:signal peptidase I